MLRPHTCIHAHNSAPPTFVKMVQFNAATDARRTTRGREPRKSDEGDCCAAKAGSGQGRAHQQLWRECQSKHSHEENYVCLSFTHSLTHSHTHTHTHILTHSLTHSLSLTFTLSLTHTHTKKLSWCVKPERILPGCATLIALQTPFVPAPAS